jgi:hypothetical protein
VELHGLKFRLHRITGLEAGRAKWEWPRIVGDRGAMMLALGQDELINMARKLATAAQLDAFAELGAGDGARAFRLLAILQCANRGTLSGDAFEQLVGVFVLGHVFVHSGVSDDGHDIWSKIETPEDLDKRLDGEHDGEIWDDLLWRAIPHSLGPTIAASAT